MELGRNAGWTPRRIGGTGSIPAKATKRTSTLMTNTSNYWTVEGIIKLLRSKFAYKKSSFPFSYDSQMLKISETLRCFSRAARITLKLRNLKYHKELKAWSRQKWRTKKDGNEVFQNCGTIGKITFTTVLNTKGIDHIASPHTKLPNKM